MNDISERGVALDHIGIPAREPRAAADFLAGILGLAAAVPDGADQDMFTLALAGGTSLVFSFSLNAPCQHMAFRVRATELPAIVHRLRDRGIRFGNDPEDSENGDTSDPEPAGALGIAFH